MAGKAWTWHRWGARRVAGFVWSPDRRLPENTGRARLTERQLEVLRSRFRHGSRKEAATSLGISEYTARGHIAEICARLRVSNTEEAAYVLWLRDLWGET